jgi:hypothetical protein
MVGTTAGRGVDHGQLSLISLPDCRLQNAGGSEVSHSGPARSIARLASRPLKKVFEDTLCATLIQKLSL